MYINLERHIVFVLVVRGVGRFGNVGMAEVLDFRNLEFVPVVAHNAITAEIVPVGQYRVRNLRRK